MIEVEGCRILEYCHVHDVEENAIYLSDHQFIFIISGSLDTIYQGEYYSAKRNEAVFIRKAQYLKYRKVGFAEGEPYKSLIFSLTNDLIKEFLSITENRQIYEETSKLPFFKIEVTKELSAFIETIQTYLHGKLVYKPFFLRLKVLEILFVLTDAMPQIKNYLYQFSHPEKSDLVKIMEKNFTKPVKIPDLAYLAGRSVSSFKRDFEKVFDSTPARWLKEKRLAFAHELLSSTDKNVTEVCFEVGFENTSHFSRIFNEHFGYNPSELKT